MHAAVCLGFWAREGWRETSRLLRPQPHGFLHVAPSRASDLTYHVDDVSLDAFKRGLEYRDWRFLTWEVVRV